MATQSASAIASAFASILGQEGVIPFSGLPDDQQQAIRRTIAQDPPAEFGLFPKTQEDLAAVMTIAHQQQWRCLLCGSGSKLTWGGLRSPVDLVLSTQQLNRLVDHAVGDMTVTVEAGMRLADLQAILKQHHQYLPVDPSYPELATIGGIIATADAGSLRHRYGGIRDLLIGISLIRSDGQQAKAGGRVVKNVAGYDLMKLFTGSYGTLGIISQATFRTYPILEASQTLLLTGEADTIARLRQTIISSALTPVAVDVLSSRVVRHLVTPANQADVGLMVQFQGLSASVSEQSNRVQELAAAIGLAIHVIAADAQGPRVALQAASPDSSRILCKLGIRPTESMALVQAIEAIPEAKAIVHAASGIGQLSVQADISLQTLLEVRSQCQAGGGYLSILEAPVSLKQQLDVWGYTGNALGMMQRLKQQFDPHKLLNPGGFVGSI